MIVRLVTSLLLFLLIGATSASSAVAASTVTVYAWPLSAASPIPFAKIDYTPNGVAQAQSKQDPVYEDEELIRIGLINSDRSWTGVVTSASAFAPGFDQKILLHTDSEGQVTHVGFNAYAARPNTSGGALGVEVVSIRAGTQPVLNKPIVLTPEGKVATPGTADTKSFLQK